MVSPSELAFYSTQSVFTDPGKHAGLLDGAPDDLDSLAQWVRNVVFHEVYAAQAELDLPKKAVFDPATSDPAVRYLEQMLERVIIRDNRPLAYERPKERCFIGTCRDYAVLMCAMLRQKGRTARVRCGFAFYFNSSAPWGLDHWVAELWDSSKRRWRLIDAEIDGSLPQHQQIVVDPLDIPRDQFHVAGTAWQFCQDGRVDPKDYGVCDEIKGEWFVAGNVLRDIASLNKHEACPFDWWGIGIDISQNMQVSDTHRSIIDELADLIADDSYDYEAIRLAYDKRSDTRLTDPVRSWPKGVETNVSLGIR